MQRPARRSRLGEAFGAVWVVRFALRIIPAIRFARLSLPRLAGAVHLCRNLAQTTPLPPDQNFRCLGNEHVASHMPSQLGGPESSEEANLLLFLARKIQFSQGASRLK